MRWQIDRCLAGIYRLKGSKIRSLYNQVIMLSLRTRSSDFCAISATTPLYRPGVLQPRERQQNRHIARTPFLCCNFATLLVKRLSKAISSKRGSVAGEFICHFFAVSFPSPPFRLPSYQHIPCCCNNLGRACDTNLEVICKFA